MIVLVLVAYRLVARWREATPPMRRVITPLFVSGALLMAALSGLLLADLFEISYSPDLWYYALVPFGLVPYLFLGSLVRAQMLRGGAVGELVAAIGGTSPPDRLRDALARALNDPSLELAYWIPETATYVDESGHQVDLPRPAISRAVSEVRHEGRLVAALIHDPLLLDEPELVDAVGAAAALALEKERLDAELRAKIAQLRESRARMLAFGLNERRRLERDLHDGAQQRLVSLALDLRLAQAAIRDDPDRAESLLSGAGDELSAALEELRELARGIHPAVLSDRGLDPAVEALASRAPLPVEVKAQLGERVAEPVELAAYFVVAEALTNVVKYARANAATVTVGRENGSVVVEVADDGVGGADPEMGTGLRGLADRISALGGRLQVDSRSGSRHDRHREDPVRVVVAEDSVLLREGIARLLGERGFEVVGQAADAEDLLRKVGAHRPDIAIVDIRMPPTTPTTACALRSRSAPSTPDTGVLVLSEYVEEAYALELVTDPRPGSGTCSRTGSPTSTRFLDAVRRVAAGGRRSTRRSSPAARPAARTTRSSASRRASARCSR